MASFTVRNVTLMESGFCLGAGEDSLCIPRTPIDGGLQRRFCRALLQVEYRPGPGACSINQCPGQVLQRKA
jgi:hypothetical protein